MKNLIKLIILKSLNWVPISSQKKFEIIYKYSLWSSDESRSGRGSEKDRALNFASSLKNIINNYNISSIVDAPCGDINLISPIIQSGEIKYFGYDIVSNLISKNIEIYGKEKNSEFHVLDMTADIPAEVDLILSRDFLFHLSIDDIRNVLRNYISSGSKFLLVTSHVLSGDLKANGDIKTGDFRFMDIFSSPFYFPTPLDSFHDYSEKNCHNRMYLFKLQDVAKISFLSH